MFVNEVFNITKVKVVFVRGKFILLHFKTQWGGNSEWTTHQRQFQIPNKLFERLFRTNERASPLCQSFLTFGLSLVVERILYLGEELSPVAI